MSSAKLAIYFDFAFLESSGSGIRCGDGYLVAPGSLCKHKIAPAVRTAGARPEKLYVLQMFGLLIIKFCA